MLNFTLSNFLEAKTINNFLYLLQKQYNEWLKAPIVFQNIKGSFPFVSWNGGLNSSFGIARYETFLKYMRESYLDFRLDFSNVLLSEQDFYSRKENFILDLFKDTSLRIEISNLALYEFLHERYPNYYFIFSKNANLMTPFTPDLLNSIAEQDRFLLISLPEAVNSDWEFLSALSTPSKYEITVNSKCRKCPEHLQCQLNENNLQLEFSGSSCAFCQKREKYFTLQGDLNIEDLEPYTKKGFNNFCLDDIGSVMYKKDREKINSYLLSYFVKPEFLGKAFCDWNRYKESFQ